jgi:phosphoribosylanthranilate isomerase
LIYVNFIIITSDLFANPAILCRLSNGGSLTEKNNLDSQGRQTRVKICGLTNLEDALSAASAGADYLGFVFYTKGKRYISEEDARRITNEIRSMKDPPILVGVFVDDSLERMAEVLDYCALDLAQMHGNEPPSYIGDPTSPLYGRSYKALKPNSFPMAMVEAEWYIPPIKPNNFPSLLIDSYHPTIPGGTGLGAAAAIEEVRPYAVDVSSGVERRPGKKDPTLIQAFVNAAKNKLT